MLSQAVFVEVGKAPCHSTHVSAAFGSMFGAQGPEHGEGYDAPLKARPSAAHAAPAPACDAPPPLGQSAPSSYANQPKSPAGVASPHSWSRCRPEPRVPPASQRSDRRDRWVHHPGRPVLAMRPPRWASEPPLFRYGTSTIAETKLGCKRFATLLKGIFSTGQIPLLGCPVWSDALNSLAR